MSDVRPGRFLFAGLGHAGRRHLRNLVAAAPAEILALRVRGRPLPGDLMQWVTRESEDLQSLLKGAPDAAVIANPTSMHVEVAMAMASAGIHVFLEKPVSDTLQDVVALGKSLREHRAICVVGYNSRFRPSLRCIHEWVVNGRIGRILSAQAQIGEWLPAWHPEEDYRGGVSARRDMGGGAILDLSHELDYIRWLVGPVRRVACFAGRVSSLEIETEDLAEILLEFESGAIGNVHVDYLQREPSRTLRLIGEEGTIHWDALKPEATLLDHRSGNREVFQGETDERKRSFEIEMEHFLECIEGKAEPAVDLDAGIEALRLAVAAKRAAERGEVINMDDIQP